ncbi:MAG: hypothetical protein J7513_00725 [Solirubrobacteraceae bacterium]|nr:hypothetical protein [Solirubrobacteraceae bacterium]
MSEPRPNYDTHAQVLRTLEAARDADPRQAPFGVLIGDPFEGGDEQFFWYPTRFALEYALLDAHAFVDAEAFEEDQDEWREPQFDLDMALRDLPDLGPDAAEELDELVNDFFHIIWIGHLDDLVSGDDPLAGALREELRAAAGRDDDPAPITNAELDDFIDLVRVFGQPD